MNPTKTIKIASGILPFAMVIIQGCSTKGNIREAEDVKVDYVAGSTGDDKVIKSEGSAFMYSDRPAVLNYNITVDAIEHSSVEGDVSAWATCQRAMNAKRGAYAEVSDNAPPCRDKVLENRNKAGGDLVDSGGKLVVRKKVDFNLAQQDAQSCLDEIVKVQRDVNKKYHAAGCDDVIREAAAKKRDTGTSDSH